MFASLLPPDTERDHDLGLRFQEIEFLYVLIETHELGTPPTYLYLLTSFDMAQGIACKRIYSTVGDPSCPR
jgi:hypothetical protein